MEKRCSRCKKIKKLEEFTRNRNTKSGRHSWCRACFAKYREENREQIRERDAKWHREKRADGSIDKTTEYREYRKKNPEKVKAQQLLNTAIKAGKIKRSPCKVCGKGKTHGHHEDYSLPYKVVWLCPAHHKAIH